LRGEEGSESSLSTALSTEGQGPTKVERSIAAVTATSASSKLVGLVLGSIRWIAGLAPQSGALRGVAMG